jgi:hypothetical protein
VTRMPSSHGRRALVLTVIAFLWSIGLLVAAVVAPVYGSATLVDENGQGVLLVVAFPAVSLRPCGLDCGASALAATSGRRCAWSPLRT